MELVYKSVEETLQYKLRMPKNHIYCFRSSWDDDSGPPWVEEWNVLTKEKVKVEFDIDKFVEEAIEKINPEYLDETKYTYETRMTDPSMDYRKMVKKAPELDPSVTDVTDTLYITVTRLEEEDYD